MSTTTTIGNLPDVKVHYHSNAFDLKKNIAIAALGLVSVTALVVGILALLHGQGVIAICGMGAIPKAAVYAMVAVGGGLVVGDAIFVVVLLVKHFKFKNACMQIDAKVLTESGSVLNFNTERLCPNRFIVLQGIEYMVYQATEGVKGFQLHIFTNDQHRDNYTDSLVKQGFVKRR